MRHKHLMVDIETLGRYSNSVVLSIAAVSFDIETGKTGLVFQENITKESCLAAGLKTDKETLDWWATQDKTVLEASTKNAKPLKNVATNFITFCKGLDSDFMVWANPARFDLGLLENALMSVDLKAPWKFWNERDVKTLSKLVPHLKKQTIFKGDKHNPLDDCYYQIDFTVKVWQHLKKSGCII